MMLGVWRYLLSFFPHATALGDRVIGQRCVRRERCVVRYKLVVDRQTGETRRVPEYGMRCVYAPVATSAKHGMRQLPPEHRLRPAHVKHYKRKYRAPLEDLGFDDDKHADHSMYFINIAERLIHESVNFERRGECWNAFAANHAALEPLTAASAHNSSINDKEIKGSLNNEIDAMKELLRSGQDDIIRHCGNLEFVEKKPSSDNMNEFSRCGRRRR